MTGESGATPKPEQRRLPRSLVIAVFGPLVGALAAFGLFMLLNIADPPPPDDLFYAVFTLFVVTIAIGWVCGLPAAAISAVIWHFAGPRLSGAPRIVAALLIGAATSVTTALPIIYSVFGDTFFTLNGYGVIGTLGAFAMAVTALPGKQAA